MSFYLEPPPGFRGLDPELPIEIYRRNLPHWRQRGATYFVTFRFADALPESCLWELAAVKDGWERNHPEPRTDSDWEDYARLISEKEEAWLDQGHGACWLSSSAYSQEMENTLRKFDGERYRLGGFGDHAESRPCFGAARGFRARRNFAELEGRMARRINQAEGRSIRSGRTRVLIGWCGMRSISYG